MNAIDNVTDFITTTSWSDLPPAIQTKSVSCLLDSLGATLVGAPQAVADLAALVDQAREGIAARE